jgi:tRNA U34 5-carboxymethylaminomethyl modifying GTPase MnmE/TrmE
VYLPDFTDSYQYFTEVAAQTEGISSAIQIIRVSGQAASAMRHNLCYA